MKKHTVILPVVAVHRWHAVRRGWATLDGGCLAPQSFQISATTEGEADKDVYLPKLFHIAVDHLPVSPNKKAESQSRLIGSISIFGLELGIEDPRRWTIDGNWRTTA
ncbi:hypothetical protein QA640_38660 [Bradyrhizobium sp. CB82]|uniref:hypothetical protein n=1 Tax=Bradyrhizobium sp. CB82 TaxID=3039159 RepID=UPI0024B27EC9|nr:hypothetical protein [Bradyrhizobium sp. CB82]WFU40080.1 hypothetical protein QA640_38660 [Bradyrhizobium sp. CB82]